MEKKNSKKISKIFEGTWELIRKNFEGINESDKVIIDKLGKYYIEGEHIYNLKAEFIGKNIHIRKYDILNNTKYLIESIDYFDKNFLILSGIDGNNNPIEYRKKA